ncbi:MAG: U32 family peptidase, partial [Prolixibacteraceae bacterium]|nr:U32 family peptidase [Prolixibacteraceae bacterium]
SRATKKKIYIGKCTNYFSKIQVAEFRLETKNLKVGDEIIVTGPTTGVVQTSVKEIRVELESVREGLKGERISVPVEPKIRRADKLFKVVDAKDIKDHR